MCIVYKLSPCKMHAIWPYTCYESHLHRYTSNTYTCREWSLVPQISRGSQHVFHHIHICSLTIRSERGHYSTTRREFLCIIRAKGRIFYVILERNGKEIKAKEEITNKQMKKNMDAVVTIKQANGRVREKGGSKCLLYYCAVIIFMPTKPTVYQKTFLPEIDCCVTDSLHPCWNRAFTVA